MKLAFFTWQFSFLRCLHTATLLLKPPQSAIQTVNAYSGSQPQTRATSRAQVQAIPDDATLQAAFSARKSCMKTQGMNILAVHPLDTDELDHLLTATCFI